MINSLIALEKETVWQDGIHVLTIFLYSMFTPFFHFPALMVINLFLILFRVCDLVIRSVHLELQ